MIARIDASQLAKRELLRQKSLKKGIGGTMHLRRPLDHKQTVKGVNTELGEGDRRDVCQKGKRTKSIYSDDPFLEV